MEKVAYRRMHTTPAGRAGVCPKKSAAVDEIMKRMYAELEAEDWRREMESDRYWKKKPKKSGKKKEKKR